MGLITPNGDGTYNIGWSTLTQTYNSLAGEVAQIKANQSAGGEINYEALSAGLYAYIDENAATSGMDSTWGKFVKKDDGEIQMLEWMQAAIKTYASDQEAYARLLAAAKDYDENGDTIQEGIARIHAFVEKDSNGNYVAGTSLSSMIEDGVNNSLSEVYTENHPNSAVAGLYARLKGAEDRADDNYEAISGLQSKVEEIDGEYIAKADLVSAITNKKDEIVSSAGLATKASLNEAKTSLSSQIDGVSASIETCVTKDSNGVIESGVTLNADKINIDANHQLNLTSPYINLDADKINMSGLITAINGDESSVVIDADKINVGGIQIDAQNVTGIENIVVERLVATKTGAGTTTVDGNGFFIEGVQSESAIRSDGSGYFADGAISWNTLGDITLGSKFISAVNANLSVNSLEAGSSNKIYVDSSNGVYVDGTCDSKINPDGSGYLGNNGNFSAITWDTNGSGSIANGNISWNNRGNVSSFDLKGDGYTVISVTNTQTDGVSEMLGGLIQVYGDGVIGRSKLRGDGLSVETSQTSYDYTASGPVQYSDMRKKDVIEDENISIESIASAPLFKYRPKGFDSAQIQIGSSAQYWQDLVPEAVSSDEEGYLRMNYITLNTVASLTSAKEIVKLKEENATLKQRVEALEARLQLIENKLNA